MQFMAGIPMPTTELPPAPSPDAPAKHTTRRFSDEEVRLLAEMMQRPEVNGNLAAAVALLKVEQPATDWSYMRCYKATRSNPYLNAFMPARNPESLVPAPEDAIDRSDGLLTPSEKKELLALQEQNGKIAAKEWVSLGLSDKQAGRMLSMERFARQPLKAMIATTHGSMMFALGILLQNFEETAGRISKGELPEELDGEGNARPAIDVERDWHKVLLDYSKEIRAIKDQIDRANLLMAKVRQMEGEGGGGKRKRKPGFAPMTVNAQPGSQVAIVSNDDR